MQDGKGARRRTGPKTQRRAIAERRCFFSSFKSRIQVQPAVVRRGRNNSRYVQVNVANSKLEMTMTCVRHRKYTEQTAAVGEQTGSASCIPTAHVPLQMLASASCHLKESGWLIVVFVSLGVSVSDLFDPSKITYQQADVRYRKDDPLTLPGPEEDMP